MSQHEASFYNAIKSIFVGAKIEGESGYINLMRIKSKYFDRVFTTLKKDIDTSLSGFVDFKEELYSKLYGFFSIYFNEAGSIYFNNTPYFKKIYEKVLFG